jgi:DUF971 family protein
MSSENHLPVEIKLHSKRRALELRYDDGARFELPCEYLRVYSPSAEVQGHHNEGAVLQVGKEDVNITEMKQVGQYALKIFFDDNHKSGLFTWNYLYDLGRDYEANWTDYLRRLEEAGHKRRA